VLAPQAPPPPAPPLPAFEVVEDQPPAAPKPARKSVPTNKPAREPDFEVVDDEPDLEVVEGKPVSSRPAPKSQARNRAAESDDESASARKKSRREAADEDEPEHRKKSRTGKAERPRRSKRSNGSRKRGLVLGGLGAGGVTLLLLGFLVFRYVSGMIAFSGQWPEPNVPMGVVATGSGESITLHILGVEDNGTVEAISERIADIGLTRGGASAWKSPRLTMRLNTTTPPAEFAQKIDFGRVHSVRGNVISIYVYKLEPPPTEPVARALRDLRSNTRSRQLSALGALVHVPPDDRRAEVIALVEPLLDDPDPTIQGPATEAFCAWAAKDNVPRLITFMAGDPFKVGNRHKWAMQALARLKDERGLDLIIPRLEGLHTRYDAVNYLIAYGSVAEIPVLKLLNHSEPAVRQAACDILGRIGTVRSYKPLAEHLGDSVCSLQAMRGLWELGPAAEDEVIKLLDHSPARARACETLGKIGTKKSLPFLEALVTDSDFGVRTHARDAIIDIKKRQ
jgi:hypothetical protein